MSGTETASLPMIPAARPLIGAEERAAVDRVLASGMIAQGPEVAAFEAEFSALVGGRACVAVNSGTSALQLALLALGIGDAGRALVSPDGGADRDGGRDEVIVPSFTFAATANVVALAGAVPVFADIDPATFCLDPAAVEAAVTPRTAAIMPVHLYGHPAAMAAITAIAERHGLAVIEDAAQAHAATLDGRPAGTFGVAAAFSFYPTKNMTSGEGGMVVTDDEAVARRVRLLRNQGMEARYRNEIAGFNMRMTDLHAAIGRVQLAKLAGWTAARRRNAAYLDAGLKAVLTPPVAEGAEHVYHQYTVRLDGATAGQRDEFAARLAAAGVGSGVYYPIPVHRLPSFARTLDLPETERAAAEVLSLPVHPALTEADLARIVDAVNT